VRRISSRHNPIVERFRAAARRETDAVMLLDGAHLVREALSAAIRIREAAVAADAVADPEIAQLIARLGAGGVETVSAIAPVMAALSPVRSSSAIVATADLPNRSTAMFSGQPLLMVAAGVQDPGNLGAIVRVAEAGGATGMIASAGSADPFGWKALRGSMGSALRLPLSVVSGAAPFDEFRARRLRIIATSPHRGKSLFETNLEGPIVLLVGGEGGGLTPDQLSAADEVVTIPMCQPVESLNAAVTAALLVYEARRQRV
jgi:RNA methyltransferase, TrmH family